MGVKTYNRERIKARYGEASGGVFSALRKLLALLTPSERRKLALLSLLTISLAFVELVGVGSIMPFLSVATNPEVIETNRYLNWVYTTLGFADYTAFLVALGLLVAGLAVFANAYKLLVRYAQTRYVKMRGHDLSTRLLAKYLSRPYVFFLNENSSDLSKNVLSEVKQVVDGFLKPMVDFVTQVLIAGSIIVLLVVVHPQAAAVVAGGILGLYGGIYVAARRRLKKLGKKRLEANRERFKSSIEAMAGIKDVKLLGKEQYFVRRFERPSRKMARHEIAIALIGKLPNHALTALINGGAVLAITFLLAFSDDFAAMVPVMGVYVFAANRLLPAFKTVFQDVARIRAAQPVVELMFEHLLGEDRVPPHTAAMFPNKRAPELAPLPFNTRVELEDVWFSYPGAESPVLSGLKLQIGKNTTVGFVGPTGCGKTTVIDIILGLLRPTHGAVVVDDTPLTEENLRNWQGLLGYVPQSIYISDDSLTRNIAFGIPDDEIDMQAVHRAAEIANLREFIETELPDGFETSIGERGVRFSGGQRQRLGIARALYHDPQVLVMDEATSALDGVTESVIMEAIAKLTGEKTIVLIAHRLTTLMDCDNIFVLEQGHVVEQGTYAGLLDASERFQRMARASE